MITVAVTGSWTARMPGHQQSEKAAQEKTLMTQIPAQTSSLARWMRKTLQNRKKWPTTKGITPASQAAQANATNGHPDARVTCVLAVFKALFARRDLTQDREEARINAAGPIVGLAQSVLIKAGVVDLGIEQVPTASTTAQKRGLVERQRAEGREGEVWVRRDTTYIGGKTGGEAIVRTKYLEETEVVITGLTPTTVAGRPFGAIEVSARQPDGSLHPVGKVGTGFDGKDAAELATLVARHPEGLRIIVRHQGRTETGMLWHARFVRVVGPVGMAA